MKISIIVTHYLTPSVLKLALNYIEKWKKEFENEQDETRAEIIVSDSESMTETREMMKEFYPDIKFLTEKKNVGFSKLVNKALGEASGEYIFIMNADIIIPSPDELNKLIGYLKQNKNVGMVGPKLLNFDETHQPSAFRYYTPFIIASRRTLLGKLPAGKRALDSFMLKNKKTLLSTPHPVDWLMGSALLTKKEYLDKVGIFDERFFMYMEDVDLCRRFWKAGMEVVYYPLATMYHFHGGASRDKNIFSSLFNKYTRIHLASAYKYFRKYGLKTPRYGV